MNFSLSRRVKATLILLALGYGFHLLTYTIGSTKLYAFGNLQNSIANHSSSQTIASKKIYYENSIKTIIRRDCGRCHSGMARNLMEYDNVKAYIDSGLLTAMISPGGPMNGFAGNDADFILTWIHQGAKEKPAASIQVGFKNQPSPNGCMISLGPAPFPVNVPMNKISYDNTIKYIIARDCLKCHSGTFRNLATYSNVKYYADNGLLRELVQLGGQMHRFSGPNSPYFITWIKNGAPR